MPGVYTSERDWTLNIRHIVKATATGAGTGGDSPEPPTPPEPSELLVRDLQVGGEFTYFVLRDDDTLWAWGFGGDGNLGQGDTSDQTSPVQIGTAEWSKISARTLGSIAGIKTDGTLWMWGSNLQGQLGLNDLVQRNSPTQVGSATWTDISTAAGSLWTVGVQSNGTLWAWGDNDDAQLGQGTFSNRILVPTQIGSNNTWVSASAGGFFGMGIRADGTLWSWGTDYFGTLGRGEDLSESVAQIGTDTNWSYVYAGGAEVVAIKSNGTLWGWGYNFYGALGLGDTNERNTPTQIGTDTDWVKAWAFNQAVFALKSDGTLWASGWNDGEAAGGGFLGLGDTTDRTTLTQIPGTWTVVADGAYERLALNDQDELYYWGWNYLDAPSYTGIATQPVLSPTITTKYNSIS